MNEGATEYLNACLVSSGNARYAIALPPPRSKTSRSKMDRQPIFFLGRDPGDVSKMGAGTGLITGLLTGSDGRLTGEIVFTFRDWGLGVGTPSCEGGAISVGCSGISRWVSSSRLSDGGGETIKPFW
ncbi:MAG: hypothetical protein ACE5GO_03155, partial [Anaerolineales bacterium]